MGVYRRGVAGWVVAAAALAVVAWVATAQGNQQVSSKPLQMYTSAAATTLYGGPQGKLALGVLTPGTPLTLTAPMQEGASRVEVTLQGWSLQGGGSVVYAAMGKRITLLTLDTAGLSKRKITKQSTDSYGNVWREIQISGWVSAKPLTSDISTVWSTAEKTYETRCSACHALHAPNQFTANQWPSILKTMAKNAALNPDQIAFVTKYLQTHARGQ